jgi:fucose 4-O-acetylase-like acetyltransferase
MNARELNERTPATRDRYVDFLRAFSIGVVVLGHWLMAVLDWHVDGVHGSNALASMPELQRATWLLQVMPLFFLVGGYANAVSLDSVRRGGGGYADWLAARLVRLVRPILVLLAVWVPLVLVLEVRGVDPHVLGPMTKLVVQLLWFVGAYLIVVALTPVMLRLHRRYGGWVLAALAGLAATLDATGGGPAYLNFAVVWLFAGQLGFHYRDGRLRRPLLLAAAGYGALVGLTSYAGYPVSMVGMPGQTSNMAPPTVCIVALSVGLAGLAMLARGPVTSWLQRPRPWASVAAVNGVIMTVLLWHLSALLLGTALLRVAGVRHPEVGTTAWWATRPLWVASLGLLLVGFIAAFGRFERGGHPPVALAVRHVVAATVLLVVGALGYSHTGLVGLTGGNTRTLLVVPVSPLINVSCLAGGAYLLRRHRDTDRLKATRR